MRAGQEVRGGVLALVKARCKVGFNAWSLEMGRQKLLVNRGFAVNLTVWKVKPSGRK